jgi:hypothetical protein
MKSLIKVLEPLSLWVLFSLLAIAFVGTRPYLALVTCVVGGIAMTISSLAGFSSPRQEAIEQADQKKGQTQPKG